MTEYASGLKGELDYFEEEAEYDAVVGVPALSGVICPVCDSGEIHQPMQTMDMPMIAECIHCGLVEPVDEFSFSDAEQG